MSARLLACPSCARHIRVDEERCPFCREATPDDFGDGPVLMPPPRGLSRVELRDYARTAARVAGAVGGSVALATLLSCCASNRGEVHPVYDAPKALPDAGAELQSDTGGRETTPSMLEKDTPIYGAGGFE